jgi:mRNA-degrading endonuclease RelE of RelBE toxin-antitoxin system
MKLHVLDEADLEAFEAATWYDDRSPGLGYDFLAQLKEAFGKIEANPRRYARVEFAEVQGEVRRLLLKRFPYLVIYQIFDEEIIVLAVSHASRDQTYWASRIQ